MKKLLYTLLFMSIIFLCHAQKVVTVASVDTLKPPKTRKEIVVLSFYGGYSYLPAQIEDNTDPFEKNYLQKLQHGFHVGIDVDFFVSKTVALGMKYSLFNAKNELNNVPFLVGDRIVVGDLRDNDFYHYFGPNILFRVGDKTEKVFFVFDVSVGCLIYRNHGTQILDYTVKGGAFTINAIPGIELKVTPNFYVNYNIGVAFGAFNKQTLTMDGQTIPIEVYKNYPRFDFSIGFRVK